MTIRRKLQAINALLVVVAVAVGVVLFNVEKNIERSVREVQSALEEMAIYKDMKMNLLNMAIAVRNMIFDPSNEEFRKELQRNIKAYLSNLKKLRERQGQLSKEEGGADEDPLLLYLSGGHRGGEAAPRHGSPRGSQADPLRRREGGV